MNLERLSDCYLSLTKVSTVVDGMQRENIPYRNRQGETDIDFCKINSE
jgi:hypothetical protein